MNYLNKYCLLLAIVILSSCISKEKENYVPTAKDVVDAYGTTIGGFENLKKITSLIKKGHYIEPAYNIVLNAQQLKMRPNYRKIGNVETVGFEEGYNGTAWEYHKEKGLIISQGEAKEAIVVASDFDFPFVDAIEKGYKLSFNGQKTIYGLKVYDVEIIMQVDNTEYKTSYYFDRQSKFLVAQRKVMPIHAKGKDVEIIVLYSDYQEVNGVLFPFTQIERNEKTGQFLNATIWSELLPNTKLKVEDFNPPK